MEFGWIYWLIAINFLGHFKFNIDGIVLFAIRVFVFMGSRF